MRVRVRRGMVKEGELSCGVKVEGEGDSETEEGNGEGGRAEL